VQLGTLHIPNTTTPSTTPANSTPNTTAGTTNNATPLKLLQIAQQFVHNSEFPYDGHRLQAEQNISAAINKLTPLGPGGVATNSIGTPPTRGARGGSGTALKRDPQSQEESDALMQHAMEVLDQTHKMILEYHLEGATDVEQAIKEVRAALKVE
jgi:hypothetical protein